MAQGDSGIPGPSDEGEANGSGSCKKDVKPPPLKNLPSPWKNKPRFDPNHHQVKPLREFLEKFTKEFIVANLGQVMGELAALTPTISNCFASNEMKSPEIFHKVSLLVCTLLRSKNRRPRIMVISALEEVLASMNWHTTSFLKPHEEEDTESIFTVLMSTLLTSKNVDLISGALQCVLRLLCSESTWEATTDLLFAGEEKSLIYQLSEVCANEDQSIPVMMVEGCRILITLAAFCSAAKRLKEIFVNFAEKDELIGEFFDTWESLEAGFVSFSQALRASQQETFIRECNVFSILEMCEFLPSLRLLLLLNIKSPSMSPPSPLSFLNRIISASHGLLFLARLPQSQDLLHSLILLANGESSAEISNFDASVAEAPSAQGILNRITRGWKVLSFCDTLKAVRGNVEKVLPDEEVLDFLGSLKLSSVRREFSSIMGKGYLHFLINDVTLPKSEKKAQCDYKLQLLLSLMNVAMEGASEDDFWLENAQRLYDLVRSKGKNAIIDVPDIHDSPIGTILRDSGVDGCEVAKWTATFASNLSRLAYTGLSEAQLARIHLAEYMCSVDNGRIRSLALHSLLASNIDTVIETKLKEQLAVALPLYQAGMADCSANQGLLLRFSLPALRILAYCMDIDPEVSILSPALITHLLGLWTLSSDLNGQNPDEIAVETKLAIVNLLQKNLFRQTTSSATVMATLIAKGAETPLYFPRLLDLLLALLPLALPLPISKRDLNKADKLEAEHAVSVKSWVDNIESLKDTRISEVLLCGVAYVHDMSARFLERIVSYEDEKMAVFFARVLLEHVGTVLQGDGYQQGSTAVPVSDDEKEQNEEESTNKNRASSAHARLMETFSALSSIQGFHTAIAHVLGQPDSTATLATMLSLFSRPWQNSERQAIYQDSVLEFIHCALSGMTEWKLQEKGNQETETVVVQLLKALLNFLVDKEQCPASVSKAAAVLHRAVEKDPRKGHQLAHLFSDGLFSPIFRRLLTEPSQEICSAASTVSQVLISLTPSDPSLIRSTVFDPAEEGKQPLAEVFEMIESADEGEGDDAVCELYLLAVDGEGKQADLTRFNGGIPRAEEPLKKAVFRLAHTEIQVQREKRRLAGKEDLRSSRGTRMGSDVAEAVRTYSDQTAAKVVAEFFAKREKRETATKADPFSQPARLKWA